MSAVLNVDWAPHGNEWVRQGDYLNDTTHIVPINNDQNEYTCDVRVIHYT